MGGISLNDGGWSAVAKRPSCGHTLTHYMSCLITPCFLPHVTIRFSPFEILTGDIINTILISTPNKLGFPGESRRLHGNGFLVSACCFECLSGPRTTGLSLLPDLHIV